MTAIEKQHTDVTGDKKKGRATSIDQHIGQQLRLRRNLMGITQESLAESVGVTFQQVQKYENGVNRVSAARLFDFAKILNTPLNFFYETFVPPSKSYYNLGLSDNEQAPFEGPDNVMDKKETLELIRVYYSIQDPKLRKNLFNFVKSMAENLKEQDGNA